MARVSAGIAVSRVVGPVRAHGPVDDDRDAVGEQDVGGMQVEEDDDIAGRTPAIRPPAAYRTHPRNIGG